MPKMETFRVLSPSYINDALHPEGALVTINTNVEAGGMKPGKALEKVSGQAAPAEGETVMIKEGVPQRGARPK